MRWSSLVIVVWSALAAPALGNPSFDGDAPAASASADPDFATGKAAFGRQDWRAAIASLSLVLARDPRQDDAQTMLAHAWRRLGDLNKALANYDEVLARTPNHRGALEYLGEAYLELGRINDANAVRARLVRACGGQRCEELGDLDEAYADHHVPLPSA